MQAARKLEKTGTGICAIWPVDKTVHCSMEANFAACCPVKPWNASSGIVWNADPVIELTQSEVD
jgi:hypothetical protein